jgi:hypothetical protein
MQRTSTFDRSIEQLITTSGASSALIARIRLGVIVRLDRFHTRPPR